MIPVSESFDFVVQNKIELILFKKLSDIHPEFSVIFVIHFKLIFNLLDCVDMSLKLPKLIGFDMLPINFL